MAKARVIKSSGNVFRDLGFPPEEALILSIRSQLIAELRQLIEGKGWTQVEAAEHMGVTQSRISDLKRGKWEKFSLDMLLILAARGGLRPRIELGKAA